MNAPPLFRKRSFIVTLGLITGLAALTVDVSLPAIPAMVEALVTSLPRGQQIVGIFMAALLASLHLRPNNPEALDYYLRGQDEYNSYIAGEGGDITTALNLIEKAVREDAPPV